MSNPCAFSMPSNAVSVTANFNSPNQYALTIAAGAGGTTTPSPGTYQHYAGDPISVSYSITSSGYTFAGWTVSGASCNGGSMSNPCAFSMPSNAVSVTANFNSPNQYALTIAAGAGGTTTPSPGTYQHYAGDPISVSYSITSSGYTFAGWTVSGASCNGGSMSNPCAFSMPSNAVSVTANFNSAGSGIELSYDDGVANVGWSINYPEATAVRFTPPGSYVRHKQG